MPYIVKRHMFLDQVPNKAISVVAEWEGWGEGQWVAKYGKRSRGSKQKQENERVCFCVDPSGPVEGG